MLAVLEMIEEENKKLLAKGERRGIKKNKIETAKRMLEEGIAIETVLKITELPEKEIMKLKK